MIYKSFVDGICDILQKNKVLQPEDIEELKKDFHRRSDVAFEDFLLEEGLIERSDLLKALGEFYDCEAIDVRGIFFNHHLVRMFPQDEMLRNEFIPYQKDGDVLIVIARNPNNATLSVIIGKYVSYDVTYFVGIAEDIIDAVEEYYDESLAEPEPLDDQAIADEERIEREDLKEFKDNIEDK